MSAFLLPVCLSLFLSLTLSSSFTPCLVLFFIFYMPSFGLSLSTTLSLCLTYFYSLYCHSFFLFVSLPTTLCLFVALSLLPVTASLSSTVCVCTTSSFASFSVSVSFALAFCPSQTSCMAYFPPNFFSCILFFSLSLSSPHNLYLIRFFLILPCLLLFLSCLNSFHPVSLWREVDTTFFFFFASFLIWVREKFLGRTGRVVKRVLAPLTAVVAG